MNLTIKEPVIVKSKKGVEYYTGHNSKTSNDYAEIDNIIKSFYKTQNWLISRYYLHDASNYKPLFKLRLRFNKNIRNKIVIIYETYDTFIEDYENKNTKSKKYKQYRFVKSNKEQLYAVFNTPEVNKDNIIEALEHLRKHIINDWLPKSDYYFTNNAAEILVFDERYYDSDNKVVEFWFPISETKVLKYPYKWRSNIDKKKHLSNP